MSWQTDLFYDTTFWDQIWVKIKSGIEGVEGGKCTDFRYIQREIVGSLDGAERAFLQKVFDRIDSIITLPEVQDVSMPEELEECEFGQLDFGFDNSFSVSLDMADFDEEVLGGDSVYVEKLIRSSSSPSQCLNLIKFIKNGQKSKEICDKAFSEYMQSFHLCERDERVALYRRGVSEFKEVISLEDAIESFRELIYSGLNDNLVHKLNVEVYNTKKDVENLSYLYYKNSLEKMGQFRVEKSVFYHEFFCYLSDEFNFDIKYALFSDREDGLDVEGEILNGEDCKGFAVYNKFEKEHGVPELSAGYSCFEKAYYLPDLDHSPDLLSIDEIVIIAHEFGHVLDFLFKDLFTAKLNEQNSMFGMYLAEFPSVYLEGLVLRGEFFSRIGRADFVELGNFNKLYRYYKELIFGESVLNYLRLGKVSPNQNDDIYKYYKKHLDLSVIHLHNFIYDVGSYSILEYFRGHYLALSVLSEEGKF